MIPVPNRDFARSVNAHNVKINVLADWIEASAIFSDECLSRIEVIDRLVEEEIYDSQGFAEEIVQDAWEEIRRRISYYSMSSCIKMGDLSIERVESWERKPAHAFCVVLSVAPQYDWWRRRFGADYTDQGLLFEKLTEASLRALEPHWETYVTGWSTAQESSFENIAQTVSNIVGNGSPVLEHWDVKKTKDMTLDILLYRSFSDDRQGFPYFMIQCASGANWESKIRDPDLNVWRDVIRPPTHPVRGFSVPFCFDGRDFYQCCVRSGGLFLDRCRLLGAGQTHEYWLPDETCNQMIDWIKFRLDGLTEESV